MAYYAVDFNDSQATTGTIWPRFKEVVKTKAPLDSLQGVADPGQGVASRFAEYKNADEATDTLVALAAGRGPPGQGQLVYVTIRPAQGDAGSTQSKQTANELDDAGAARRQFLRKIYALDARDPEEAIDVLVDHLDDLQNAGNFDEVEAVLFDLKPSKLSDTAIVSALGVTLAAKTILVARRAFYRQAVKAIAKQRGSEQAALKLLAKYR